MAHFVPKRSHRSGNYVANSSHTCFCIPLFHFRNSGIRVAKTPEFRYVQKTGNSGIPELQSLVAIFTDTRVYIGLHATTDKEKDKQIGRYSSSKGKRTRSQVFFFKKKLCDIGPNQNL